MNHLAREPSTVTGAFPENSVSCDRHFLTENARRSFSVSSLSVFPYMSCLFDTTNGDFGFHLQHHEFQIKPSQIHRSFLHLTRSTRCLPRRMSISGPSSTPPVIRQPPTCCVICVQAKSLSRSSQLAAAMFETFSSPFGPKSVTHANSTSPHATPTLPS